MAAEPLGINSKNHQREGLNGRRNFDHLAACFSYGPGVAKLQGRAYAGKGPLIPPHSEGGRLADEFGLPQLVGCSTMVGLPYSRSAVGSATLFGAIEKRRPYAGRPSIGSCGNCTSGEIEGRRGILSDSEYTYVLSRKICIARLNHLVRRLWRMHTGGFRICRFPRHSR